MLHLTRRPGESVVITVGHHKIEVFVEHVGSNQVKLAFEDVPGVEVWRDEIYYGDKK